MTTRITSRKWNKNQHRWVYGLVQLDKPTYEPIEEYIENEKIIKRYASGRAQGLPQQHTARGYEGRL